MPPHAPSPGQIARSMASTSSRVMRPRAQAPTASNASMIVTSLSPTRPGQDRPGVEEDRGDVEPGRGHEHRGLGLVAAGEQHAAVEALGLEHRLDGVGDHLAAHERVVHADVAHRDAVGHRDRAELQRVAAGGVDAVLRGVGQPVEREVARRDLVPRRGDADLRLDPVVVAHADGAQHAARRGALETVGDGAGPGLDVGRLGAHGPEPTSRPRHDVPAGSRPRDGTSRSRAARRGASGAAAGRRAGARAGGTPSCRRRRAG